MVIVHSYVSLPEGNYPWNGRVNHKIHPKILTIYITYSNFIVEQDMLSGHKPLSFATHASGMVKQSSFSWGRGAQDDEIPQVHQSQSIMNHDKISINFRFARLVSNPCSSSLNRSVTVSVFVAVPASESTAEETTRGGRCHVHQTAWTHSQHPCVQNCRRGGVTFRRGKCGKVFQHVSTCFNMFQHVSTCFNMFQPPQEITGKWVVWSMMKPSLWNREWSVEFSGWLGLPQHWDPEVCGQ